MELLKDIQKKEEKELKQSLSSLRCECEGDEKPRKSFGACTEKKCAKKYAVFEARLAAWLSSYTKLQSAFEAAGLQRAAELLKGPRVKQNAALSREFLKMQEELAALQAVTFCGACKGEAFGLGGGGHREGRGRSGDTQGKRSDTKVRPL